jgi:hypothetical protein
MDAKLYQTFRVQQIQTAADLTKVFFSMIDETKYRSCIDSKKQDELRKSILDALKMIIVESGSHQRMFLHKVVSDVCPSLFMFVDSTRVVTKVDLHQTKK